jgi:triphosphoribosyl-dephospho-CoA synthase
MSDVGLFVQLACTWEVTARKPGNVTRFHDFDDVTYLDFLLSAAAIAPVIAGAAGRRVGATVLEAVRATRRVVRSNTNLGIILLLAPLAAAGDDLRTDLPRILAGLDVEDSRLVYEAIRLAAPGGLGSVENQDVRDEPSLPLREVMTLAADRDRIALQYSNGYAEVFGGVSDALLDGLRRTRSLEAAIIHAHLLTMRDYPDTLIARKAGAVVAEEAARRAGEVFVAGWPGSPAGWAALDEFDAWLRADGRRRNPGTTADLITAGLFVLLREGRLPLPVPWQPVRGSYNSSGQE